MWSIIAASVVDLPEPVVPVSEDDAALLLGERRDDRRAASRSSIERMSTGIARETIETSPRWRKALTRKRATPSIA